MENQGKLTSGIENKECRELGLYLHIPFCIKKCDYCDFLSAPADDQMKEQYVKAIITEISSYQGDTGNYIVPTLFFGGGTPSSIEERYIAQIMEAVYHTFPVDKAKLEATIEVNPGTLTKEKLLTYKSIGINRISFGLQSVHNNELKLLGRIHSYEQFEKNYSLARELGFQNINIDLMSALPGQTLQAWEDTLYKVIRLKPEHISAYSLIIEEGTKFYEKYHDSLEASKELPDEDADRLMYHRTKEILAEYGYCRYEISNYAKPGFESRHNSSYWLGTDYLGIGLGASSLLNGARFSNLHDIKQYIQLCERYNKDLNMKKMVVNNSKYKKDLLENKIGLRVDYERLSLSDRMEEFMFLGLRMCRGISRNTFFQRFGQTIDSIYGKELERLINNKLVEEHGDNLRLTEYGIDISNTVLSVFLLN